jgi:hypothetical protein
VNYVNTFHFYIYYLFFIIISDLSTGINITARPNKIVAGLDVAKTNELLQAIGKALDKKVCILPIELY